ncbi:hypothetical protein A6F68_02752 [Tsuneonella dongtanensis]|uniref:DUF3828 domain-containing protein n=1 Tax=Tsuneonella dongtanensis TaxID=692370 RepID=A0A1B2AGG7_9SPHN|nr:hypothetical protein [Tsuneonella dongtanensis]ANY21242.1 hypothetical protein A6F68_02752 [Tsuneonella dongtanensis]
MTLNSCSFGMPGRFAPAFLFALAAFVVPSAAQAQQQQRQGTIVAPPAARPVPDQLELTKMIWSTLLAVDHANKSGNYSVLRDMSAQGFQINNDPARLAQVFAGLRTSGIDLSNSLVLAPTFFEAPRQIQADVFEVKGVFQLRPSAIQFDIFYQWEQGRWKLFGIDIQPISMAQALPGSNIQPVPQQPAPAPRRR